MRLRQWLEFVALGAIWGASFLFMRVAVPAFGPVPLIALRVAIGALVLVPIVLTQRQSVSFKTHAMPIAVVGLLNSAVPFTLFAYATIIVTSGFAALLNATVPIFTAIVGLIWFRQRLEGPRLTGVVLGFLGAAVLVSGDLGKTGHPGAIGAGLVSSLCYAIAAHYTRQRLGGVAPLAVAAGSQVAAALALAPLAIWAAPTVMPPASAWAAVLALGLVCTGLAYAIYFRLLATAGAGGAVVVTYLIPVFGMIWGGVFLDEAVTATMLGGCSAILAGVALVQRAPAGPGAVSPAQRKD